jgi:cephalosporin hydroxylase
MKPPGAAPNQYASEITWSAVQSREHARTMKLIIDTDQNDLFVDSEQRSLPLYSDEAFDLLSRLWLKVGWNQKYIYTFTWLGRPIIQLPDDMLRIQEVLYRVKPSVLIETGVAHGGSLVFYASVFAAMGHGRVIGVDIDIRPANQAEIEQHELSKYITLIQGDSVSAETVKAVAAQLRPTDSVLVVLDSNHTSEHVVRELEVFGQLVTPNSYIVVADGIMKDVHDAPRGKREWWENNPAAAVQQFVARHPEFRLDRPKWSFNESTLSKSVTHWPHAYLRRC